MHPHDAVLLDAYPFSASYDVDMLVLLALCHPFGFLCFFASFHVSTLSLDRGGNGKTIAVVTGPHSTTRHGNSSRVHGAPLKGRSRCDCVVHMKLRVLSFSVEEGRSTFGFRARIWAKF